MLITYLLSRILLVLYAQTDGGVSFLKSSGVSFDLTLRGQGFSSNDRLGIVPLSVSCGTADANVFAPGIEGITEETEPDGTSTAQMAIFKNIVIILDGTYRLCFCHGSCTTGTDFSDRAGFLNIKGPDGDVDIKTKLGVTIPGLTITGRMLTDSDQIRIVKVVTCGDSGSSSTNPVSVPVPPPSSRSSSSSTSSSSNWPSDIVIETVGIYKLCWCSGAKSCTTDEDFNVLAGSIKIAGPQNDPDDDDGTIALGTFHAGQNFDLQLKKQTGIDSITPPSDDGNFFFIFQTNECGDASLSSEDTVSLTTSTSTGEFLYTTVVRILRMGTYRLCYCGFNTVNCSSSELFNSEVRTFTIQGPAYDAILIADQIKHTDISLTLTGTGLNAEDKIILLTTSCDTPTGSDPSESSSVVTGDGQPESIVGDSSQTWTLDFMFTGIYYICWCSFNNQDSNEDEEACSNFDEYRMFAGIIDIAHGPIDMTSTVIAGAVVSVTLAGIGLLETDRISLIHDSDMCEGTTAHVTYVGISGTDGQRTSGSSTTSKWENVIILRQGTYKVCWCGSYDIANNDGACQNANDFHLHTGTITVTGATWSLNDETNDVQTTTTGTPIDLVVNGDDLHDWDRIRMRFVSTWTETPCGVSDSHLMDDTFVGLKTSDESAALVPNSQAEIVTTTTSTWEKVTTYKPGKYYICWCGSGTTTCVNQEDFNVQGGKLEVTGDLRNGIVLKATASANIFDITLTDGTTNALPIRIKTIGDLAELRTDGTDTEYAAAYINSPGSYLACFCPEYSYDKGRSNCGGDAENLVTWFGRLEDNHQLFANGLTTIQAFESATQLTLSDAEAAKPVTISMVGLSRQYPTMMVVKRNDVAWTNILFIQEASADIWYHCENWYIQTPPWEFPLYQVPDTQKNPLWSDDIE